MKFNGRNSDLSVAIAVLAAAAAAGCGGSGGGNSAAPAPTMLSGVVASGAPLAGATITVTDSDATTANPAAVTTGADGSYSIDVSALKAPLLVTASGSVQGAAVTAVAVVPTVVANASNTANVTPLTLAVAALIAPGGDPQALTAPSALASSATTAAVANATALIVNTLATDTQIASTLGAGYNPLTTPFKADGSGIDGVLDKLDVNVASSGVTIANLAAAVGSAAVPATVTLTPAQTSTPTVVPTLAPSAAPTELPSAADLAALGAKYEACLALPLAQRVTLDSSGNATAVLGICNYAPADWKSSGRNWVQQVGQYTFAKPQLTGAKVGKGQIVLTMAAANSSDAKEFKHPYCNTTTCVIVRWPLTSASGFVTLGDWTLAKVAGAWNFVGNQLPYNVFVEPRMYREIAVNRDGAAAGSATDPYYYKDRYESTLRLIFDPSSPGGTSDVRAVRFSGPGLPAGGVVSFRSQGCATYDRFGITYQNGATRRPSDNALVYWTGSASTDFVLDAANLDGSALAMPTPVFSASSVTNQQISPTPIANQAAVAPAWSRYKIEVFHYSTASDTPDEIIYVRSSAAAENASAGTGKPWPTLASSYVNDYLKPTGASAGSIGSLAQTMSWTASAGSFVLSSYLYASNSAVATNSQNETASYTDRTRLDYEPAAFGDLTANGVDFADATAGTSMSSYTSTNGSNPNPRCTSTSVLPLTASSSDYREAGLLLRGDDRKLYVAWWFWRN